MTTIEKLDWFVGIFLLAAPAFLLALIAIPFAWRRDRLIRFACTTFLLFTFGLLLPLWVLPHYTAPGMGLLFLLLMQSMRHLHAWRPQKSRLGMRPIVLIVALCVLTAVLKVSSIFSMRSEKYWFNERPQIIADLNRGPDQHLIIVRYSPKHHPFAEWVYNDADIDKAKVVWAREMDTAQNRKLIEYFKDRHVWLLEADAETRTLVPYSLLR